MLLAQIYAKGQIKNVAGAAIGNGCWGTAPGTSSRRRDCHSAVPPSAFIRCFNRDKKGVSSK